MHFTHMTITQHLGRECGNHVTAIDNPVDRHTLQDRDECVIADAG